MSETKSEAKTIRERILFIIVDKLDVDEKEVTDDKTFSDLGSDSLDTVELLMECEREFNFSIPDEQAEKLTTVGSVINYVENNIK